jgi:TatD DNase family protein
VKLLADTHAHICDPAFDLDREVVLERALKQLVSRIVAVGENLEDAEKNLELAEKHSIIRPAAGLYPTHLDIDLATEMLAFIRTHKEKLIAIGR